MVAIPKFVNELRVPGADLPRVDPAAIAAPAVAFTRGVEQVSDEMRKFAEKREQAKQQADAAKINVQGTQYLDTAEQEASKFDDQDAAYAAWDRSVKEGRAQFIDPIADPEVKAHAGQIFDMQAITRRNAVGKASFANESSRRVGELDTGTRQFQQSIAATDDPMLKELLTDAAIGHIKGLVAGGYMRPEEGAKRELAFRSDVQETQINKAMAGVLESQNPDQADKLGKLVADPANFKDLDPATRERKREEIARTAETLTRRQDADMARKERDAEKNQREMQTKTATEYFSRALKGEKFSAVTLGNLVASQQLSIAAASAIGAEQDRAERGHDDFDVVGRLRYGIENRTVNVDAVWSERAKGNLTGATAEALAGMAGAAERGETDQAERSWHGTLTKFLGGTGLTGQDFTQAMFGSVGRANEAKGNWAEADAQWTRRVQLGKEDPAQVFSELMAKYYVGIAHIDPSSWLAAPKMGPVTSVKDAVAVGIKTMAAHDAGQMDAQTYQGQVDLISRYRIFYLEQEKRAAAAAALRLKNAGLAKQSEPGAPR